MRWRSERVLKSITLPRAPATGPVGAARDQHSHRGLQWSGDTLGPRGASPRVSQMLPLSLVPVRGLPLQFLEEAVGQISMFPSLCILVPHVSPSKK